MLLWASHGGIEVAAGGGALSAWQREERARREAKAAMESGRDAWKLPGKQEVAWGRASAAGGRRCRSAVRESRGVGLRWKKMDCFAISEISRDPNVNKQ